MGGLVPLFIWRLSMKKFVFQDAIYTSIKYTIHAEDFDQAERKLVLQTGQPIDDFKLLEVIH